VFQLCSAAPFLVLASLVVLGTIVLVWFPEFLFLLVVASSVAIVVELLVGLFPFDQVELLVGSS
jgi:hypothetical protein